MIQALMRARTLVVLALITACGGATPKGADAPAQAAVTDPHASIGDLAAREGGLIGGANASAADGASGSFKADQVEAASPVKLDGALREWPARAAARTVITGAASSGGFAAALQYDDTLIADRVEDKWPRADRILVEAVQPQVIRRHGGEDVLR